MRAEAGDITGMPGDKAASSGAAGPPLGTGDVLRMLRGDDAARRRAIESLYDTYAGRFRSYYLNHGATSAEADDWVQETFVRVLRFVDTLRDDTRLAPWIWKTARNVMIDALRRDRRLQFSDDDIAETVSDSGERPLERIERESVQACINRAYAEFAKVHPDRAQCLVWAAVDELAMEEIAGIIGRSVGATREYISQCRKKLRPYLAHCLDELD